MPDSTIYNNTPNFFGDLVYQTVDEWGDIMVIDQGNIRTLTFGSIYDQSSMDKSKPYKLVHEYTGAMMLVLAFIKPSHATILGLGAGCQLRSLYHTISECKLHAIELRQCVYEVAVEFFGIPLNNNITITIADVKQQLKSTEDRCTNIIFADLYSAYGMEPFQAQEHFINECYRILSDKGWLVVNYHELPNSKTAFFKFLFSHFANVFIFESSKTNNTILFAGKYQSNEVHQFEMSVIALEKKLGTKLTHLLKRLTRLK